jgi:hypothetical protein
MRLQTLRPGLLVSLKTSIVGNADYRRIQLEADHLTEEGTKRARWETQRTITDPAERERAIEIRSQARAMISKVCAYSSFGLLCPDDRKNELDTAIEEAQIMARTFNETAKLTRVSIFTIAGYIAPDDEKAVRAINSEVRELIDAMDDGIKRLDVKAVREAANKAKSIGRMMTPEAEAKIQLAVNAAREVAKSIVKAGEEAGKAIDGVTVKRLRETRTMFLDIDEEPAPTKKIAKPKTKARAVELEPEAEKPADNVVPLPKKAAKRKAVDSAQLELGE